MTRQAFRWSRLATTEVPVIRSNAVIVATATLCVAALASAHRMPGSISTVKRSASGDTIEIIHRLHTHDAELGIAITTSKRNVSLETLVDRAQLALYVEERFSIAAYTDREIGNKLALELIGAELDGEFVLVYQEFAGDLPAGIAIRDDILRDVFPGQVNHVNVATGGEVRSVTFSGDDEWLTLALE
jgi:hypothetical protein